MATKKKTKVVDTPKECKDFSVVEKDYKEKIDKLVAVNAGLESEKASLLNEIAGLNKELKRVSKALAIQKGHYEVLEERAKEISNDYKELLSLYQTERDKSIWKRIKEAIWMC